MARPLFPVTAAARLDIGLASPSRHIYFDLVAEYSFGTPVIHGRSPSELAATKGIAFYNAPGDPGIDHSVPGVVVVSFPYPIPSVEIGGNVFPVDVLVGGGTIVGANYTDGNGQFFPDVDWEWAISVEAYQASGGGTPSPGRFDGEVVFWTGDGTANRLIPTSFALDIGDVAVWGCGGIDKTGNTQVNFFRHNGPLMTGTALCGFQSGLVADGITGFTAGGFRVSDGSFAFLFGNTAGVKYAAVVMRDTSGVYLRIGNYKGVLGAQIQAFVTHGSPDIQYFGGIGWAPTLDGTVIEDTSGNQYVFTDVDANNATISPPFLLAGGIHFFVVVGATAGTERIIPIDPQTKQLTDLWVWGSQTAYKSDTMPGKSSVQLLSGPTSQPPNDNNITAIGATSFSVTDDCNTLNVIFSYVGLCTDAAFILAHFFRSLAGVATGNPLTQLGIGFTPALAFARQGSAINTDGARWKAFTQAILPGTSIACSIPGGAPYNDTTGITAIGVDSVDLGIDVTSHVAGDPFYTWFWTGGSLVVPGSDAFELVPPPIAPPATPGGGILPPNVPAGGGQACRIGSAGLSAI